MNWRDDKTLIVLCGGIMLFTVVTIAVVAMWQTDGQIYTLFAAAFGQFTGALMMHLKTDKAPPPGTTTVTNTAQVTSVPPEEPK